MVALLILAPSFAQEATPEVSPTPAEPMPLPTFTETPSPVPTATETATSTWTATATETATLTPPTIEVTEASTALLPTVEATPLPEAVWGYLPTATPSPPPTDAASGAYDPATVQYKTFIAYYPNRPLEYWEAVPVLIPEPTATPTLITNGTSPSFPGYPMLQARLGNGISVLSLQVNLTLGNNQDTYRITEFSFNSTLRFLTFFPNGDQYRLQAEIRGLNGEVLFVAPECTFTYISGMSDPCGATQLNTNLDVPNAHRVSITFTSIGTVRNTGNSSSVFKILEMTNFRVVTDEVACPPLDTLGTSDLPPLCQVPTPTPTPVQFLTNTPVPSCQVVPLTTAKLRVRDTAGNLTTSDTTWLFTVSPSPMAVAQRNLLTVSWPNGSSPNNWPVEAPIARIEVNNWLGDANSITWLAVTLYQSNANIRVSGYMALRDGSNQILSLVNCSENQLPGWMPTPTPQPTSTPIPTELLWYVTCANLTGPLNVYSAGISIPRGSPDSNWLGELDPGTQVERLNLTEEIEHVMTGGSIFRIPIRWPLGTTQQVAYVAIRDTRLNGYLGEIISTGGGTGGIE